jgi:hypothetical protein
MTTSHLPPDPYLALVTSEHNPRLKFMAWLTALLQTYSDQIGGLLSMPLLFDLDTAVGVQLDATGEWIGQGRYVDLPLEIYFSWDMDVQRGWDSGIWYTSYAPLYETYRMDDNQYRLVLKAKVGSNRWDGTIPMAYEIYNTLFAGTGTRIGIIDHGLMHMSVVVLGHTPDRINKAILTSGLLDLRPSAVHIDGYWFSTVEGAPYFGFDVESDAIKGYDEGAWGELVPPTDKEMPPFPV